MDPEDTRYEIGSVQDQETNERFEEKYKMFNSIAEGVIIFAAIVLSLYSLYSKLCIEYPAEMQEAQQMMAELKDSLMASFTS